MDQQAAFESVYSDNHSDFMNYQADYGREESRFSPSSDHFRRGEYTPPKKAAAVGNPRRIMIPDVGSSSDEEGRPPKVFKAVL